MHQIFNGSPSRKGDYERILSAAKEDYPQFICSIRWVENANVAKKSSENFAEACGSSRVLVNTSQR